jgi:hypothetical protein
MANNTPSYFTKQSKTQRDALLDLLKAASGKWVPLPDILGLGIAQYSARIHELRKEGFRIENRTERINDTRHSWFRLVSESAPLSQELPWMRDRAKLNEQDVQKRTERSFSDSTDWYEAQTGKPRPKDPAPESPILPLFDVVGRP